MNEKLPGAQAFYCWRQLNQNGTLGPAYDGDGDALFTLYKTREQALDRVKDDSTTPFSTHYAHEFDEWILCKMIIIPIEKAPKGV